VRQLSRGQGKNAICSALLRPSLLSADNPFSWTTIRAHCGGVALFLLGVLALRVQNCSVVGALSTLSTIMRVSIHPTTVNVRSRKFRFTILNILVYEIGGERFSPAS
jgi:hypothetical protein